MEKRARIANLAARKGHSSEQLALIDAVAPVKIRVGGYLADLSSACLTSPGMTFLLVLERELLKLFLLELEKPRIV